MEEVTGATGLMGDLGTIAAIAIGFTAVVVALAIFMWQVRSHGNAQQVSVREENARLREQVVALREENERQRAERERQREEDIAERERQCAERERQRAEDIAERERQRAEDRAERERFWSELQRQNGRLSDAEREQARQEGANQTLSAILREQSHTHEAAAD